MTTSINTILKNRKNRKNKKGFSLVELIVVLVIMAILAAALVPTLIGYINQTRQSNAKNEAASVVQAAQTIVSSAYANPDGIYINNTESGKNVKVVKGAPNWTISAVKADGTAGDHTVEDVVKALAEVKGTITANSITVDANGVVSGLTYTAPNNEVVTYSNGAYDVGSGS